MALWLRQEAVAGGRWNSHRVHSALFATLLGFFAANPFNVAAQDVTKPRLLGAYLDHECRRETLVAEAACFVATTARATAVAMRPEADCLKAISTAASLAAAANYSFGCQQDFFEYLLALEVTNYVQNAIHAGRYDQRSRQTGFTERVPGMDVERSLAEGIGICGAAVEVASAILRELGYRTRRIQMFYVDDRGQRLSHIALEAFLGGKWAFLEPTWGVVFAPRVHDPQRLSRTRGSPIELLSFNEIRAAPTIAVLIENRLNGWRAAFDFGQNRLDYMYIRDLDVTVDGHGTITLPLERKNDHLAANFSAVHNFVGDGTTDGKTDGVRLKLHLPNDAQIVTATVAAPACAAGSITLNGMAMTKSGDTVWVGEAKGESVLAIESQHDVCYFVLSSVTTTPATKANATAVPAPRQAGSTQ